MSLQLSRTVLIGLTLALLIGSCSRKEAYNVRNCSNVWNGQFYNVHNGQVDIQITRNGDIQTERATDGSTSKYKVEWLDSCRYRLTFLSAYGNFHSEEDSPPVIVQITEVRKNSYTIEGWVEGTTLSAYTSEVFKE